MKYWIFIGDASRARVFETEGNSRPLKLVRQLDFPTARARNTELVTDGYGRYRNGASPVGPMSTHLDPHEEERQRAAIHYAGVLQQGLDHGEFERLAIVAPPHFMGVLKLHMGPHLHRVVEVWLDKDLAHIDEKQLPSHLAELSLPSIPPRDRMAD